MINRPSRILITDAHAKQAYAAMCSLTKRGVEVSLLSPNPVAPSFASRFCKRFFISPPYSEKERYLEFVLERVQELHYDLLIPCDDVSVIYFSESRDRFKPYVEFVLPDHRTVETVAYKDNLVIFAKENGIPIPKSACVQRMEEYEKAAGELEGDIVVVKGVRGAGARQVRYARKGQIEEAISGILKMGDAYNPRLPILQEYVPGPDTLVLLLCDRGEVLALCVTRTIRRYPTTGGLAAKAVTVEDPQVDALTRRVAKAIGWHGMAGFAFRQDSRDGRYKLLEINPRFGGRTQISVTAGVDLPYLLWHRFVEKKPLSAATARAGAVYRSLFPEELLHLLAKPSSLANFIADFFHGGTDYGWHPFEWKVVYRQLRGTWWEFQDRCRAGSFRYPCGRPPASFAGEARPPLPRRPKVNE